ncbi:MAG: hypothetical protein ACP5JG_03230 [Anaerolineae bacterium]
MWRSTPALHPPPARTSVLGGGGPMTLQIAIQQPDQPLAVQTGHFFYFVEQRTLFSSTGSLIAWLHDA